MLTRLPLEFAFKISQLLFIFEIEFQHYILSVRFIVFLSSPFILRCFSRTFYLGFFFIDYQTNKFSRCNKLTSRLRKSTHDRVQQIIPFAFRNIYYTLLFDRHSVPITHFTLRSIRCQCIGLVTWLSPLIELKEF